ncbi:MAG: dTDP-4-dehydrorhamnose reductase [Treponema sp.]|jgi:dTDP-4-dehydrorhamnose reductase|nr:dTDP-4-dehydrorhamnose reductase [Treponema sp.]
MPENILHTKTVPRRPLQWPEGTRLWLIGSKGMLGTEFARLLEKQGVPFAGTDREVDITDPAALDSYAEGQSVRGRINWIVNCAAYTAVDKAEDDVETCRNLNTVGPGAIARTAKKVGARLIHLSTDYVFDGQGIPLSGGPVRPYREDDNTNPTGVYGLTKRDGERRVLENNGDSYIIRSAWLYGEHGNNFVHTMLRLMNEREEVKVVNDQRGSPTWAADLSRTLLSLILAHEVPGTVHAAPVPGIYHYTNEGAVTWFDFAQEIYRQGRRLGFIKKDCTVRPCSSAEYPARLIRPAYSVLDTAKIKTALDLTIPPWDKSLRQYLESRV